MKKLTVALIAALSLTGCVTSGNKDLTDKQVSQKMWQSQFWQFHSRSY